MTNKTEIAGLGFLAIDTKPNETFEITVPSQFPFQARALWVPPNTGNSFALEELRFGNRSAINSPAPMPLDLAELPGGHPVTGHAAPGDYVRMWVKNFLPYVKSFRALLLGERGEPGDLTDKWWTAHDHAPPADGVYVVRLVGGRMDRREYGDGGWFTAQPVAEFLLDAGAAAPRAICERCKR